MDGTRAMAKPLLGRIADDFTGATDLCNTPVRGGETAKLHILLHNRPTRPLNGDQAPEIWRRFPPR